MRILSMTFVGVLACFSTAIYAEACTYNEAVQALHDGNKVRAIALLRIAAGDGDRRADSLLAQLNTAAADQKTSPPPPAQIASASK